MSTFEIRGGTSVPIPFQSNVGNGFNPSPFVPPVTSASTLLFGFIQVIQLKLDSESLKRYPGPILQDNVRNCIGKPSPPPGRVRYIVQIIISPNMARKYRYRVNMILNLKEYPLDSCKLRLSTMTARLDGQMQKSGYTRQALASPASPYPIICIEMVTKY